MNRPRHLQNVVLTGFMGSGKSAVGRHLAAQLRFSFLDTDAWIESRARLTISEIFDREGEPSFRQWECRAIEALSGIRRTVIATGGGMIATAENLARLKEIGLVVCLWSSPETVWERVRHQHHRPLLQDPDPLAKIRRLFAEREPYYRQADVLVSSDRRSIREVAHQVLHQFHFARQDVIAH